MTTPVIQTSLNSGEITPALYGRVDIAKYRSGCSTLRNMFVSYRGGAASRAGTAFAGQSKQDGSDLPPVLIPFQYSIDQGYTLEFGDFYMRVIANGAFVTEDGFAIDGATNATPGDFDAPGNDFAAGDWIYLSGLGGMTQVNGSIYVLDDALTSSSFTLKSTLTGTPLVTADFGVYTSGGTAARVYMLATPYAVADLPALKWSQSADVMTLTHNNYPPYDLARIGLADWTLTETTFSASISPPITCSVTATTVTSSTATQYQYVVTAIDALSGEESIASPIATVTNSVNIGITLGSLVIAWPSVSGASQYNIYKAPPSYGAAVPVGSLFGYAGSSFGLGFTDTNVVEDLTVTPPKHFNPFAPSAIDYFVMTNTGSGYTASGLPSVVITDPTGSGATGEAVVVSGGVQAIIVDAGGQDYTDPQVFIVSAGGGSGANIQAASGGGGPGAIWHGNKTIVSGGSGYLHPSVIASYQHNGNTIKQNATSVTVSTGVITACNFDAPAYSIAVAAVTITVTDSVGSGAAATAHVGPSTGTYPNNSAYFQDRRYYANTINNPDTYFGSQPGAFTNMDSSIPVTDGDAIVGTPWAQQVNGIQAMVPMPGGLVILTGLGAWQLSGGSFGAPVTPVDQVAQAQAYNGCAPNIRPLTINYDILYVQAKGSIVRDLSYNFFTNIYTGSDLTMLSNHLFENYQIVRWDWAEEPNKLVWIVRSDGALLSLTYLKDQDVWAWARHDTNGLFQSVACVSEPPVNAPYFVVKRLIQNNGTPIWAYYIERMDDRLWAGIESAWCLDCAISYPMPEPDAILTASSATGNRNIGAYNLIAGGSGYTSPVGVITDDGGGLGAEVQFAVVAGVITGATPATEGQNYVHPVLTIMDSTGSGAVVQPIVTNYVTFSASENVFSSANPGDVIRMGGGKAEIVQVESSTACIGNILVPITATVPNDPNNTPVPAGPGDWTLTTPVSTVGGLSYLEGMSVSALADGGVVNNLVVTNGEVTLPAPASAIIVGLPFAVQMQTLYLETQAPVTIQTRRKNVYQVAVRVAASRAPQVGCNQPDSAVQPNQAIVPWANMSPIKDRGPFNPAGLPLQLYTGDYDPIDITGDWDSRAQIAIQQTDPVPLTVLAVVPYVDVGDKPG